MSTEPITVLLDVDGTLVDPNHIGMGGEEIVAALGALARGVQAR